VSSWLVGGLEHFLFFHIYMGNIIIPTDELHHFSEGWVNHQPVLLSHHYPIIIHIKPYKTILKPYMMAIPSTIYHMGFNLAGTQSSMERERASSRL
jgi:predicted oxidoreductase